MEMMDKEFFKQILAIFDGESKEHIQAINEGLAQLVNVSSMEDQDEIMVSIHRAAHSLKGAARTVGLTDLEPMCQTLESAFSYIKKEKLTVSKDMIDLFGAIVEQLGILLGTVNEEGKISGDKTKLISLVEELTTRLPILAE